MLLRYFRSADARMRTQNGLLFAVTVRGMHTECELNIQIKGIPSNVFLACVQKVSLFHGFKRLQSRSRGLFIANTN